MRKKSLAMLLALVMLLGLVSPAAQAAEPGEDAPAVETVETETVAVDTSDADLPDHDELFAEYVQQMMYPQYGVSTFANFGMDALTGLDKTIYEKLKAKIKEVAKGELNSASFTLTWEDLDIQKTSWTEEELGTTIIDNQTISQTAIAAVMNKIGYNSAAVANILDLLLVDCPYELYWFDKSTSQAFVYPSSLGVTATSGGSGSSISLKGEGITFSFKVSKDYSVGNVIGTTDVDVSKTGAASQAVDTAKDIVRANAGKSDYEKLLAYKNWICENVSYNEEAAAESYQGGYGDPWQIIYVFDGKSDTNVVCEGYAKAFQYLCDLSTFHDAICYTVSGTMSGDLTGGVSSSGGHMCNIVRTSAGSYLVDVTNCDGDEGASSVAVGYPDKLFLKAPNANGSVDGGYTFTLNGKNYTFAYDDDDKSLYGSTILTLAEDNYPVPALSLSYTAPSSLTIDAAIAPMNPTVSNGSDSYTFAVKAGPALPDGLTLDTATGVISGTPTTYSASSVQVTITVTDNGDNDTAEATVTFPAVSKKANTVTFTDPAAQFVEGQPVSFTATAAGGGEITYAYKAQNADDNTYSAVAPTEPGSYTVRATAAEDDTWQSASATHDFTIVAKAVESIEVTTEPTQTTYVVGQELNTDGMVVTATYNDETTADVTNDCTVSPEVLDTAGTQTITVTHTDSGKTATFDVTVTAKELTGITVEGTLQKEQYQAFDHFNPTGLTVKARYNDGTDEAVTGYTVGYQTGDCLHAGDTTVTISYQGETAQVTIPEVSKISLNISDAEWAGAASVPYDGMEHTVSLTLPEAVRDLVDVEYSGTTATYVGSYSASATVTAKDAANYEVTGTVDAHSWSITAVSDPAVVFVFPQMKKGGDTLDLSTLVSGNQGAVSFAINGDANGCTLTGSTLTSGSATGQVKITATIADTDVNSDSTPEYTGRPVPITVTITEKDTAALTVSQSGWTYGDTETPDPVYTKPDGMISETVVYTGTNSPAKPTAAGDYTVTVTCETADTIYTGTASFTIARKDISGAAVTLNNTSLIYTGAEQTVSVTAVTVGGVPLTVTTDYTVGGTASGTDAGTYTVTVTGAGNYTGTASADWEITPKTIRISGATAVGRDYAAGNTSVEISGVTFDTATLTKDTDYTVTGAMADANAGDSKSVTVTVALTGDAAKNYQLSSSTYNTTVTISKINWTQTAASGSARYGAGGTVDLASLIAPGGSANVGTVAAGGVLDGTPALEGTVLSFAFVNDSGKVGSQVSIPVNVSGATNYNDYTITVTVTVTNKLTPTLTVSPITVTYTGKAVSDGSIRGTAAYDGKTVSGTWSWTGGNAPTTVAQSGTYSVTFTPDDTETYTTNTATVQVTINKATPAGAPGYTAITTSGKTLADAKLTIGSFTVKGSIKWADDASTVVKANTDYKWIFTPDDTNNYNPATGAIELWHRSSSGSSSGGSSSSGSSGGKTETEKNPDGSTTTTVTSSNGTVTETTKYPDGSKEVVETKKDGTVTTTSTDKTGNETKVVENPNGSSKTTVDNKDGSSSTTTVSRSGQVEAEVNLPVKVIEEAAEAGEAVALPMPELPVTSDRDEAPTVTMNLAGGRSAKVEIPVDRVTPGTVAILVKADGTEQIVKTAVTTDNGVAVTLSDGDTVKVVDNSKNFTDVSGSYWAADAIDFATSRELFAGNTETTFNPGGTMTRAMIWTVLARYDGTDTTNTTGGVWYTAGQTWAMDNGISDGSNANGTMTREQLATMLYRYAQSKGQGFTGAWTFQLDYPDAERVSSYAYEALCWMTMNGVIGGMTDGTLNPQGSATRAQVATILQRYVEVVNG